jgi:hypothetical protein
MANTKPHVTIFDCETQETIVREATADEIAQFKVIEERAIATKTAKLEADAKRAALLEKLGITANEAQLLLG